MWACKESGSLLADYRLTGFTITRMMCGVYSSLPQLRCALLRGVASTNGMPSRTRTCNPRFWRPILFQLSYWHKFCRKATPATLSGFQPDALSSVVHRKSRKRRAVTNRDILASHIAITKPYQGFHHTYGSGCR